MKVNLKSKSGITLVALIITIIVLLILAMVSIALVMNSGIITKSKTAVDKYSEEEIQEQIKLAYSEWQMGQYTGVTEDASTFVKNKLNSIYGAGTVANVTAENGILTVELTNGKTYTYNVATGKAEKVAKWVDNGDDTFTNSETGTKVQIGDIVNYNELSNGAKSYTTDTTKGIGGSVGTKDSTTGKFPLNEKTYTTEDLTWRVLGVNASGQIELISENPTSEEVYLANKDGYLYGPDALNTMCDDLYGKGTGAVSARSLNADDVDKVAGIKTDNDKLELNNHYNKYRKYKFTSDGYYYSNSEEGVSNWSDWITGPSYINSIRLFNSDIIISKDNPGETEAIKDTYYYYELKGRISDNIIQLLSGNEKSQWLATTRVNTNDTAPQYENYYIGKYHDVGEFCILNMVLDNVVNGNGYNSQKCFIRPVVTLKSNVKLSGSSESGWTIE